MKLYCFITITLLCTTFFTQLHSQGALASADLRNIDVEKLSDADIKGYYEKAMESGLSEDQLLSLAKSRGLSDDQADKLRMRVGMLTLTAKKPDIEVGKSSETNARDTEKAERSFDEKLGLVVMDAQPYNRRIFGSELFTSTSTTFEPNLRIATPLNYVIGPDDELIINVYGYSEKTYRQPVNAEGTIYIENVGPILVSGLTFEEAEAKIRSKLASTIYKAMAGGGTKMQLRLGNIRSMRITIIGEAKKPGTYTVSSLTSLFNALYLCGGPTDNGSYRNIELIRNNVVIRKVDLYRFLSAGDRSDNLLLQEQDVIRIPYYESRIVIDGYVKRPGIYEIKDKEKFDQVFGYAGRFSDSAYRKAVTIYQIDDSRRRIKDLAAEDFASYSPQLADSVVVTSAMMRFANRVQIKGAVMRPGNYELQPGMDLKDLINKAGGVREDVFKGSGNILRLGNNLGPENVSFNLENVLNSIENIPLQREDEVIINSIFDLQAEYTVQIDGEVNKPGQFKWRKDLTLRDLILLAGGVSESAAANQKMQIEISRRVRNAVVTNVNYKQSEIIRIVAEKNLTNSDALLTLEPYDMVVVRPQPGYKQQRSISIGGPVLYPGKYYLEKNGERISDILKRAGGFQSTADSSSVFIRRFKTNEGDMEQRSELIARITNLSKDSLSKYPRLQQEFDKNYTSLSVNLTKALANPGSNEDLIMENGDLIIISPNSSLVKVSGEVYFPTMIPYEPNTNLRYYIKRTGDYTNMARKNQAFVIYPDGKAEAVKKFLFFRSYPKVTPRSEVFVPSKGERSGQRISTGELIAFSSIIATLGTLIVMVIR